MKNLKFLLPCLALTLVACQNDTQETPVLRGDTPMAVTTLINGSSRAMITDVAFSEGSQLGITLVENTQNATTYDGLGVDDGYFNVLYTAGIDDEDNQKWTSQTPILLSGTDGKAVAYYPYSSTAKDYTSIPMTTQGQTDYMYSGWYSPISNAHPDAVFEMKHALSAIRVRILKGSYTSAGNVTAISLSSDAFGTAGKLDASTGNIKDVTVAEVNTYMMNPAYQTLVLDKVEKKSALLMVVPVKDVQDNVDIVLTIDGKEYNAVGVMTKAFASGNIYTFDLTLNNTGLGAGEVTITPWVEDNSATTENGGVLTPSGN